MLFIFWIITLHAVNARRNRHLKCSFMEVVYWKPFMLYLIMSCSLMRFFFPSPSVSFHHHYSPLSFSHPCSFTYQLFATFTTVLFSTFLFCHLPLGQNYFLLLLISYPFSKNAFSSLNSLLKFPQSVRKVDYVNPGPNAASSVMQVFLAAWLRRCIDQGWHWKPLGASQWSWQWSRMHNAKSHLACSEGQNYVAIRSTCTVDEVKSQTYSHIVFTSEEIFQLHMYIHTAEVYHWDCKRMVSEHFQAQSHRLVQR